MILCGNQSPCWTADDIISYTEPKLGYTRDRWDHAPEPPYPPPSAQAGLNAVLPPPPQPWVPALHPSFMRNVDGREESFPAVHHRLLHAAPRWPG